MRLARVSGRLAPAIHHRITFRDDGLNAAKFAAAASSPASASARSGGTVRLSTPSSAVHDHPSRLRGL